MGVYYKLVNLETHERIEPSELGGGGIKRGAMVFGPCSQMLAFLHMHGQTGWTIENDGGDDGPYFDSDTVGHKDYCENATEKYRLQFNEAWPGDQIERSK